MTRDPVGHGGRRLVLGAPADARVAYLGSTTVR